MAEWIHTLIAVGGTVLGVISGMIVEYFKHRLKSKERCQELLIEKRIFACSKLKEILWEFHKLITPLSSSMVYQEGYSQLQELHQFVMVNNLILGVEVVRAWDKYFKSIGVRP